MFFLTYKNTNKYHPFFVPLCSLGYVITTPPQAWTLEVSPDGSFVLSGGHDRSLRLWRRTEEMVFLEEEREKEMEGLFESELDRDDVAAPGADGLALPAPQRKPEGVWRVDGDW